MGKMRFIHIPRTGGSYVRSGTLSPIIMTPTRMHQTVIVEEGEEPPFHPAHWEHILKSELEGQDVFCSVRNPFEWLVCHYNHCNAKGGFKPFTEFVKGLPDTLLHPAHWDRLLWQQMFSSDGDMIVDWVNRQECLDEDLELMAEHYGLKYEKKRKANTKPHPHYMRYYEKETLEIVSKKWTRECGMFGYSFDGLTKEPIVKHLNVMKDRIKYFIDTDVLLIDGKEYYG